MRRISLLLLSAGLLAACNRDTSSPTFDVANLTSFALQGGFAYGMPGIFPGRGTPELRRINMLPDSLKLTGEQEAQINALLEAFQTANKADLDALNAIMAKADSARRAGKSREEVHAILQTGDAIRTRLGTALDKLRTDIDALLTAAQKAWLESHHYERCNPDSAVALTDAQKAQIQALIDAFKSANQTDLDAVKAALQAAHDARKAGKTQAEIQAILDAVKPALDRLHAAGETLRTNIDAVLTAEQKASNCFGRGIPGFGFFGPGGRHGPHHGF
jgi:Spy/CpxP family protein refolding chaperone